MDTIEVDWTAAENPGLVLQRGPGEGDRLMAPGVPDEILAAGGLLCWSSGDVISLADPKSGRVRVVALDSVDGLAAAGGGVLVLTELGVAAVDLERGQHGLLGTDMVEELERVAVGGCLLLDADETRACFTLAGAPIPLPDGAMEADVITPLADGPGVAWADEDRLYTSGADGRPRELTRLPERASRLVSGPGGALVASLPDGTCCAVSGGLVVELEEDLLLETARFSADGRRVLAASGGGVALLNLSTGAVERVWPRGGAAVGFIDGEPLVLDEELAAVIGSRGEPIWTGFHAAGPAWDVPVLIGPAGAAWDLSQGRRVWPEAHLSGGVTAFDGERALHVSDRDAALLDEDGAVLARWRVPLFPQDREAQLLSAVRTGGGSELDDADEVVELAWLDDRALLLTAEGELGMVAPEDGALLHRESLGDYAETDGWQGLTPLPRARVLVRIGDGGRVLPGGPEIAPPPGAEVQALLIAGSRLYRAWGGRVECASLAGDGGGWSTSMRARLLANGRRLMAAEGDDLVLLDAESGKATDRSDGVLEGCNAMAVLSDGNLWAWGGFMGLPRVVRCDGRTGAPLREWELPAAGVVTCGGAGWAWTEEGALYRLELG